MRATLWTMALAASALAAAPTAARAQLWDTGPWDGADARASVIPSPPSAAEPAPRAADDFVLPTGNGRGYRLTALSARMLVRDEPSNLSERAIAEIYADNNGRPAAAPMATLSRASATILQTAVVADLDLVNLQFDAREAGLLLAPGRYWVAIAIRGRTTGDQGPDGFFCTAGSGRISGSPGFCRSGSGPWLPASQVLGFPSDFSFTLWGRERSVCAADLNADGAVTIQDLIGFLGLYASGDAGADVDSNGMLDVHDLLTFITALTNGC